MYTEGQLKLCTDFQLHILQAALTPELFKSQLYIVFKFYSFVEKYENTFRKLNASLLLVTPKICVLGIFT